MSCTHCPAAGLAGADACPGRDAARICELAASRPDYRRLLADRARAGSAAVVAPPATPAALRAVAGCPSRGSVLSHTLQRPCGCGELTECRAGRGAEPGRVTLRECLACVSPA